jgi:hypothetical protein
MRKLWMGLALGSAVGAGMQFRKRQGAEETDEPLGIALARAAAGPAAAGAAVGLLLDRRSRRKVLTRRQKLAAAKGMGTVLALADAARPRLQSAADSARPVAKQAAGVARERASQAADAARPVVRSAADAARPHVEHAGELARARAQQATKAAKAKLAEVDLPVLVAV